MTLGVMTLELGWIDECIKNGSISCDAPADNQDRAISTMGPGTLEALENECNTKTSLS
jgi:hypothetical protein